MHVVWALSIDLFFISFVFLLLVLFYSVWFART